MRCNRARRLPKVLRAWASVAIAFSLAHHLAVASQNRLLELSLEPSPIIEAYKRDVDRTLLQENLKLTPQQRLEKMMAVLRFTEELRLSGAAGKAK